MQNIDSYELDPNFAVVFSFLKSFGKHVGEAYDNITIESFKEFLEAEKVEIDSVFVRLHCKLIRDIGEKAVQKEWEKGVIKFCKDFPDGDDKLVKEKGYCSIPVHVKLRILKNLCEDQFEYNDRFNRSVNDSLDTKDVDTFRERPLGRDKLGRSYWFLLDETGCLRLFRGWRNDLTGAETWNLVCRDFDELDSLIEYLASEDLVLDDPPWPPVKQENGAETGVKLEAGAKTEVKSQVQSNSRTKAEVGTKTQTKSEAGAKTGSRVTSSEETEIKPKCEPPAGAGSEGKVQNTVKDRTKIESWTKYAVKTEPISTSDIDFKAIADNVADMMASSKHYYRVPSPRKRRDVRREESKHRLRACTIKIKKSPHVDSYLRQTKTDSANENPGESAETPDQSGDKDNEPREKVKLIKKGTYKSVVYDPADEVEDDTQESAEESGEEGKAGEASNDDCDGESEPELDDNKDVDGAECEAHSGPDVSVVSDKGGDGSDNDGCGSVDGGCESDNSSCAENSNQANDVIPDSRIEKSQSKRHSSASSDKDKHTSDTVRRGSTDDKLIQPCVVEVKKLPPSCVQGSPSKTRLTDGDFVKDVLDTKVKPCVVALKDISPCKARSSPSKNSSPVHKLGPNSSALKPCIVGLERLKSNLLIGELQNKSNSVEGNDVNSQKVLPNVGKSRSVSSPSKHKSVATGIGDADSKWLEGVRNKLNEKFSKSASDESHSIFPVQLDYGELKCTDRVKDKLKKKLSNSASDECSIFPDGDLKEGVENNLKKELTRPDPVVLPAVASYINPFQMKGCIVKLDKLVSKDVMNKVRRKVTRKNVGNNTELGTFEIESDASDDNFHETIEKIANTINLKDNQVHENDRDLFTILPVSESGDKNDNKAFPSKKAENGIQDRLMRPWETNSGSDCNHSSGSKLPAVLPITKPSKEKTLMRDTSVNHKPNALNEVICCDEAEEEESVKSDKSSGSSRDSGNGSTDTDKQNIDNALKDLLSLEEIIKHGQGVEGQDSSGSKRNEPVANQDCDDDISDTSNLNNDSGLMNDHKDENETTPDGCGDRGSPRSSNQMCEKSSGVKVVNERNHPKSNEVNKMTEGSDKKSVIDKCSVNADGESENNGNKTEAAHEVVNCDEEEHVGLDCDTNSNSSIEADTEDVMIVESDSESNEKPGDLSAKLDCFTKKVRDELNFGDDSEINTINSPKQDIALAESESKIKGNETNLKKSQKKPVRKRQPKRLTSPKKSKKVKKAESDEPMSMMIDGELVKIEKVADSDSDDVDIMNTSDTSTKSGNESDTGSCDISKEKTMENYSKEEKDSILKMYTSTENVTAPPPAVFSTKKPTAGADSHWSSMIDQALESLGLPTGTSISQPAPVAPAVVKMPMPSSKLPIQPMIIQRPVPQPRPIQPKPFVRAPLTIRNPILAQNMIHPMPGSRPTIKQGVSLLPKSLLPGTSYSSHMYQPPILPKPLTSPHMGLPNNGPTYLQTSWSMPINPMSTGPVVFSSAGTFLPTSMPTLTSQFGPCQMQTSTTFNHFSSGYSAGFPQPSMGLHQSAPHSTLRSIISKPPLVATSTSSTPYVQFTVVKGGNGQFINKTTGKPFTFPPNSRVVTLGPDDKYHDHKTGEIVPVKLNIIGPNEKKPNILCLRKAAPKLESKPAMSRETQLRLKDKLRQAYLIQKLKDSQMRTDQLKQNPLAANATSLEQKEREKRERLRKQLQELNSHTEKSRMKHRQTKEFRRPKKFRKRGRRKLSEEDDSFESGEEDLVVIDKPEASSSADSDYEYEKISRRVRLAQTGKITKIGARQQADSDSEMDYNTEQTVQMVFGTNARLVAQERRVFCLGEDCIDQDLKSSCKTCGKEDNPDAILVCDDCEECYHMACLCPPLIVFPLEDWFCPKCEHVRLVEMLKEKHLLAKRFRQRFRRRNPRNEVSMDVSAPDTTDKITVDMFRVSHSNILQSRGRSRKVNYSDDKFDQIMTKAVKDAEKSSSDSDSEPETPKKSSKTTKRSEKQKPDKNQKKRRSSRKTPLASKPKKKRSKLTDVNADALSSNNESDYNCSGSESSDEVGESREDRDQAKKEMERSTGTEDDIYFTCSGRKTSSIARVSKYL